MTCEKCGSDKIQVTDKSKRTCAPKGVKKHPNRKISYGYFYKEHLCECGNKWEVRK